MKVKIKDLEPNPYRDMGNYPLDQKKLAELERSILKNGFWDNILARKNPKKTGKFQIAYGHHRFEILKKLFKPNDEVDIPVKELDDASMIQIMANENMESSNTSIAIVDETIRATKKFLEDNPNEAKKLSAYRRLNTVGANVIKDFLGWDETRVRYSLERINQIDCGELSREAVEMMPTEGTARAFMEVLNDEPLTLKQQGKIAKQISEASRNDRGKQDIKDAVMSLKYKPLKNTKSDYENKVREFSDYIAETRTLANDFSDKLSGLIQLKNEFQSDIPLYEDMLQSGLLITAIQRIRKQFENLINNKTNGTETNESRKNILCLNE